VKGSADGQTWSQIASSPKRPMMDKDDVLDISLDLKGESKVRYVRLSFSERTAGSMMTLVECEIWGSTGR
jgi:hypothetical protein